MARLIHDRYVARGVDVAWDLATGEVMSMADVERLMPADTYPIASLVDVLEHGREGVPRWIVADVRRGTPVSAAMMRAAEDGGRRGYVPIAVEIYQKRDDALSDLLRERALLLLATPATPLADARSAFMAAAASCARPHVLLTLRGERNSRVEAGTRPGAVPVVREARAVYSAVSAARSPRKCLPDDVARQLARAARVTGLIEAGCHAAAERLLRDVAGALRRREVHDGEARVLLVLGTLLQERGRTAHADRIYGEAIAAAERSGDEEAAVDGRIAQASARTDARQLTAAESICRAVLTAGTMAPVQRAVVNAALARVLLAQGRDEEAAGLDLALPADAEPDARTAFADDMAVRVAIARGQIFVAGQRARAALNRCGGGSLARAIAARAHLRVMVASGDLQLVEESFAEALTSARRARAPLQAVRAYLLLTDAMQRAGQPGRAARAIRMLRRMRRAAPPLLRAAIDARLRCSGGAEPDATVSTASADAARVFVQLSHEREDDRDAVAAALDWTMGRLRASRIDLWSCDAGPASVIVSTGSGVATTIGGRVLDSGISIGPDLPDGREIGVPVRLGSTLVAALVARWPVDRSVPGHAGVLLELAAAVAAPRVDRMQAAAREVVATTTVVPELVGVSDGILAVRKAIARAAGAPFSVLIEGESGVGKELVARAIHELSPRRERRFCDLNCAALPDDLVDAELFGHTRGAFTGAVSDRAGLFEQADGGTLFLDELADLSPRAQAKLLRAVQEQEVRRIGEAFARKVDVRIVAAANRDMRGEASAGRFRQDLLYRLDVIRIRIPPLRERPADISVLAAHFWRESAARVGSRALLTHGVFAALSAYAWPGNVRELQNVIAALAVAAPTRGRVPASLLPPVIAGAAAPPASTLADARQQFERRFVEAALARAGGRRSKAARDLGVSRQGLLKLLARLGLSPQEGDAVVGNDDTL